MKKDLLRKLLINNANIATEYFRHYELYSTNIEINICPNDDTCNWKISGQNSNKSISESVGLAHSDLLTKISRLIDSIDDYFYVKCIFKLEGNKIMTELSIECEERSDGKTKTWIYHKVKSEESAELLLIQAKKFIVDELTKIKESIS